MKAAPIVAAARARKLPFLIAGGHAVIFHHYPRSTFDLHLVIRKSDRDAWIACALETGFKPLREGPAFLQFDPPGPDIYATDLMPLEDSTFEKMAKEALPSSYFDGAAVIGLLHLIAMKCHAIKHTHGSRIVKDADDVIRLAQANAVNLDNVEVREVFLKYGTPDLYEKVKRACGGERI